MPSLFKPTYTAIDKRTGKKVKRKTAKWYGQYREADGNLQRVPLATDKAAAQALLAKLVRQAERQEAELIDKYDLQRRRSIREHLEDYRRYLEAKGSTRKHVAQTLKRLDRLVIGCHFEKLSDLDAAKIVEWLALQRRTEARFSARTSNFYQDAIKAFASWLVLNDRIPKSPLNHLQRISIETDRRHDRRALSAAEFLALIRSATTGPVVQGMAGRDRAMLYVLAAWTGFRRAELASLTLESLELDSNPPLVRVRASYSKRRREDCVPLHSEVVARLNEWLGERGNIESDAPLFELRTRGGWFRNTAKMMQQDLERAGIAYRDERGLYADFHANRHTFVSNLARSDVAPKTAQSLARHSDINLTMNVYAHVELEQQAQAIEGLPSPPVAADLRSEIPTVSQDSLALWLAQNSDFACPEVAQADTASLYVLRSDENSAEYKPKAETALGAASQNMSPIGGVHPRGLEPLTFGSVDRCSIQLS